MLIYQEFLALNEELPAFDPSERLRYAVHEIMIRMKDNETIKFGDLSDILKKEFKIDIPEEILKEIFDKWDKYQNADYSIFKKEDKNWMDSFCFQGFVKRKVREKQSFGKHRKKDINYTNPNSAYGGNFGRSYSPPTTPYDKGINRWGDWYGD